MQETKEYKEKVEEFLRSIDYQKEPHNLYAPIKYTINNGGKRIRPILLLIATDLFDGDISSSMMSAVAIEIFHNFTLLHDDIMDNAPLRRGQPTVHSKWNQNIAILSGDVMMMESIKLLSQNKSDALADVLQVFTETAIQVCEGQQYDMDFEKQTEITVEQYIEMITMKTAVLLAASLKIGALEAGASSQDAQYIYDFGKNIGIAFQLMDDYLDVYGDQEKVGKQIGGDILTNKKTYLMLQAKQLATGQLKKDLEFLLSSKSIAPQKKVEQVTAIFSKLNIEKSIKEEMEFYYNIAMSNLDSIEAPIEKRNILGKIAKNMMDRRF